MLGEYIRIGGNQRTGHRACMGLGGLRRNERGGGERLQIGSGDEVGHGRG